MQDEQHPLHGDRTGEVPFADLPLPPPDDAWLHDMDDAPIRESASSPREAAPARKRRFGFPGRAPAESNEGAKRPAIGMRSILVACLIGMALIGYVQYGGNRVQIPDLLGTALPSTGLREPISDDMQRPVVDPRLGGPEARQLDLGIAEETVQPEQFPIISQESAGIGTQRAGVPGVSPTVVAHPTPQPAPTMEPGTGPSNAEMLEQLRQMQAAVAALSQQLGQVQQAQAAGQPTPRIVPAQAPATRTPAPATEPEAPAVNPVQQQRPHQAKAEPAKATARSSATSRTGKARAPEASQSTAAEKPARIQLSGQLVAVDMWNGEPSVVVASGLPGDRRLRVLRPGDVVNGLSLKSADPVARSATFAVPGSPGLTLFVNQGG